MRNVRYALACRVIPIHLSNCLLARESKTVFGITRQAKEALMKIPRWKLGGNRDSL